MSKLNYKEIESYFNNNNIDDLLKIYEECFNDVDYYETQLIHHKLSDIFSVREAIQRLSGLYMSFRKPLAIATTSIENGKARHYHHLKMKHDTEESNKKFISSSLDREASYLVAPYRRARNLFEAYVASCEKSIVGCQSLLSSLKTEKGLPQG